jgi:hypothetical protein
MRASNSDSGRIVVEGATPFEEMAWQLREDEEELLNLLGVEEDVT